VALNIHAGAAGLLAAGVGLAVADLVAQQVRPESAPLFTVGGTIIDATPTALKEFAVRTLGNADKPVLLAGIGLILAALAATAGVVAANPRRRWLGIGLLAALGLVGAVTAMLRPDAGPLDLVPGVVAATVAALTLVALTRRRAAQPGEPTGRDEQPGAALGRDGRRQFLRTAGVVTGIAVVAAGGSAWLRRGRATATDRARNSLILPPPASPAPALPAGAGPDFVTPNREFYRVDTALTVPRIDPDTWQLRITGMVDRPRTFTLDQLLDRPLLERHLTLNCVSNEVGGPYIGTAKWLGASLASLIREAGPQAGADQLVARGADGMTIGTPLETVLDGRDTMLVVGMNGEPLPADHGFPVRMLTPGVYGYVGSCKWLIELEVTTFDAYDVYWVKRGWAAKAPVKTASRIDRPAPLTPVSAGPVRVAGVAWAQRRGIASVEVQVDDGPWRQAALAPSPSIDTWVQWSLMWPAEPGEHRLRVRATDRTGAVQVEPRVTPFPDGATGWHTLSVTVN